MRVFFIFIFIVVLLFASATPPSPGSLFVMGFSALAIAGLWLLRFIPPAPAPKPKAKWEPSKPEKVRKKGIRLGR